MLLHYWRKNTKSQQLTVLHAGGVDTFFFVTQRKTTLVSRSGTRLQMDAVLPAVIVPQRLWHAIFAALHSLSGHGVALLRVWN
jgi:hypothetical protein